MNCGISKFNNSGVCLFATTTAQWQNDKHLWKHNLRSLRYAGGNKVCSCELRITLLNSDFFFFYIYSFCYHISVFCAPGFGGDGINCTICPVGTYKSGAGNHNCSDCPTKRSTEAEGASSLEQCRSIHFYAKLLESLLVGQFDKYWDTSKCTKLTYIANFKKNLRQV